MKDERIQELANALATAKSALGHGKANRNRTRAKELKASLEADGIKVPCDSELLDIGKFNGKGSC